MPKEDLKDLEKEQFELIHEGWNGHWHVTVYPEDSLWLTLNLGSQISKSEPKDSAEKSFELSRNALSWYVPLAAQAPHPQTVQPQL